MAMQSYGGQAAGLSTRAGDVTADNASTIISTDSFGANAILTGQALQRETQAGVANGDWAISNTTVGSSINNADEALPYWSFTDTNSAGAITCAIVADSGNASGNVLRWSVAGATGSGKSATLTRYCSVPGSRNREYVFVPEMTLLSATASTAIYATIGFTWYKSDGVSTTGTGNTTSSANTFTVIGAGPTTIAAVTSAVNTAAPSDAAFMLITITVATSGIVSAGTKTVDIAEVRIASGQSDLYVAENTTPSTYGPSRLRQANGTLTLSPNLGGSGAFAVSGNQTVSGTLDVSGVLSDTVSANDKTTITGGSISSTGTAVGSNVLTTFVTSDANNRYKLEQNGKMSWGSGSGAVDTVLYRASAGVLQTDTDMAISGNLQITSGNVNAAKLSANNPASTASAANVRYASTSSGQLLYSTSSRRWKTDITDADAAVLDAAKKLRPRHFVSLHAIDADKRLLGLIAEEVDEAGLGCAVERDADGLALAIDYNAITAALITRIQDLEERLAALEA